MLEPTEPPKVPGHYVIPHDWPGKALMRYMAIFAEFTATQKAEAMRRCSDAMDYVAYVTLSRMGLDGWLAWLDNDPPGSAEIARGLLAHMENNDQFPMTAEYLRQLEPQTQPTGEGKFDVSDRTSQRQAVPGPVA